MYVVLLLQLLWRPAIEKKTRYGVNIAVLAVVSGLQAQFSMEETRS